MARSILITGCSEGGIGYDAAHALRDRGWRVFASCRQETDCAARRAEGFESPRIDYTEPDTIAQGLAAVLGGTQSLHTNSMDETLALPTEKAVRIALRTQQILAYETGVPNTVDPLAGSYYVEALTNQLEAEAEEIFRQVGEIGGVVPGIEKGWFQRGIERVYQVARRVARVGGRPEPCQQGPF